ncbi:MAG: shikimate dehydrogenase [Acidimicrobiales bacterium]|nr:shikimate dehydrogenase [Acidimicrobiales bacterium]
MAEVRPPITGATRIAAVIGDPVRHSRSPALIDAALVGLGLDWRFVAFEVAAGGGAAAVDAMRTLGLVGLSVTMPLKAEVIPALDRLAPAAEALGAVNCIARDGDELVGHNTDGDGLVRSLADDHDLAVAGRRCVVLGAGGAARSVVRALADAGAAQVVVANRTPARAEAAAALAGAVGAVGGPAAVAEADVVVNATSVGMGADPTDTEAVPVDPALIQRDQAIVDLVYQPLVTPLLRAAAARGARPIDGLGMLVHQAALAVERWSGREPDVAAMAAAARA